MKLITTAFAPLDSEGFNIHILGINLFWFSRIKVLDAEHIVLITSQKDPYGAKYGLMYVRIVNVKTGKIEKRYFEKNRTLKQISDKYFVTETEKYFTVFSFDFKIIYVLTKEMEDNYKIISFTHSYSNYFKVISSNGVNKKINLLNIKNANQSAFHALDKYAPSDYLNCKNGFVAEILLNILDPHKIYLRINDILQPYLDYSVVYENCLQQLPNTLTNILVPGNCMIISHIDGERHIVNLTELKNIMHDICEQIVSNATPEYYNLLLKINNAIMCDCDEAIELSEEEKSASENNPATAVNETFELSEEEKQLIEDYPTAVRDALKNILKKNENEEFNHQSNKNE